MYLRKSFEKPNSQVFCDEDWRVQNKIPNNNNRKSPLKEYKLEENSVAAASFANNSNNNNNENITNTSMQFQQILMAITKLETTVNERFEEQNRKIESLEMKMNGLIEKNNSGRTV